MVRWFRGSNVRFSLRLWNRALDTLDLRRAKTSGRTLVLGSGETWTDRTFQSGNGSRSARSSLSTTHGSTGSHVDYYLQRKDGCRGTAASKVKDKKVDERLFWLSGQFVSGGRGRMASTSTHRRCPRLAGHYAAREKLRGEPTAKIASTAY